MRSRIMCDSLSFIYLLFIVLSFDIATLIFLYCNVNSWRILRLSAH